MTRPTIHDGEPYRYLNSFIDSERSASDMIRLKLFPNVKEITESMGALRAATNALGGDRSRARWDCWSIDPALGDKARWLELERVRLCRTFSQNVPIPAFAGVTVVLAVHSHAPLREFWLRVGAPKLCVAIPCCVHDWRDMPSADEDYDDQAILSKCRRVMVWKDGAS